MNTDIIIIGAGVVGCALARCLSAYDVTVAVLEHGSDVADGASKANSGIVHAGFDAKPGSHKASLNVRGAAMYEALCHELGVPFRRNGTLVAAFEESGRETIEALFRQGKKNGVPALSILEQKALLQLEPSLNPKALCALYAPTGGIVSPYELTYALADHAAINGVHFDFDTTVLCIEKNKDGFLLKTSQGDRQAKWIVNCAGIDSARLHNCLSEEKLEMIPRKGEYYLLERTKCPPFTRTIFQVPTNMGKGVLVSPTIHGNMLLGPTAQDLEDGLDVSTTAQALTQLLDKARLTWPEVNLRGNITTFAGVRAHITKNDFIVGGVPGIPGAYEAVGIESPGLTAAPAIAEQLCTQISRENEWAKKREWHPAPKRKKPFFDMDSQERMEAVSENPQYGNVVCRCEHVTEAEVREAIRKPIGAKSVDGVKRRIRAGMGLN